MLTKFEVSHFKSFNEKFVFDLSLPSDYQFNQECIKNGIVNKGIIYGENGSGKSNLGLAIFDIVSHLTDNNCDRNLYENYLNAESKKNSSEFSYFFTFEGQQVEYYYGKSDVDTLVYEKLVINNKIILAIDKRKNTLAFIDLEGAENLNKEMGNSKISLLNYVKNNTVRPVTSITTAFDNMIFFVEKMLLSKSLFDGVFYIGFKKGLTSIFQDIIERGNLKDFEFFLNKAGVQCQLEVMEFNAELSIAFVFSEKKINFMDVASTGTKSLLLFYFWLQRLKEIGKTGLVFLDEFDAFYHHELSEFIVEELKKISAQVILTTHNTSIMSNDLLRPDCYFLMTKEKIKPLTQCTDRELRFGHNLEKMYRAEVFDD